MIEENNIMQRYCMILLIIFCNNFFFYWGCTESSYEPNNDVVNSERTWREISVKEVNKFKEINEILINPVALRIWEDEIYILDRGSNQIIRLDKNRKLRNRIGKGYGRGPGELQTPSDFFIDKSFIWIADSQKLTVEKFRLDGEFVKTVPVKERPFSIIKKNENLILHISSPASVFKLIDQKGSVLKSFGANLISDQHENFMALSGRIYANSSLENKWIYMPIYFNTIYIYNDNLLQVGQILHPEPIELPVVNEASRTAGVVTSPGLRSPYRFYFSGISDSNMFMNSYFTGVQDREGNLIEEPGSIIDVYDIREMKYMFSFENPVVSGRTYFKENHLYLINRDGDLNKFTLVIES
jgi:hypothetical protein